MWKKQLYPAEVFHTMSGGGAAPWIFEVCCTGTLMHIRGYYSVSVCSHRLPIVGSYHL